MLTRLRPNMKVFELEAFYVDDFYMAVSNARKHHREQNPTADDHCLKTFLAMPTPWQEDMVMQYAKELGYNEAWSTPWFIRTADRENRRNKGRARRNNVRGADGKKRRGRPPIPPTVVPRTSEAMPVPENTASGSENGTAAETQLIIHKPTSIAEMISALPNPVSYTHLTLPTKRIV